LELKKVYTKIAYDKLTNEIPVKMNTMQDKQNRVINFDDAVEVYNKWTSTTNSHMPISQDDIAQKISTESKIYAT
jgi:glucokinase